MNFTAIIQARARKELLDAWIWYQEKQAGLGDRFETEVYNRIKEIEQHPQRYLNENGIFVKQKLKLFHICLFILLIVIKK